MIVKIFTSPTELQAFLTANAVTNVKVASIYYDGASGKHVLVYTP